MPKIGLTDRYVDIHFFYFVDVRTRRHSIELIECCVYKYQYRNGSNYH